MGKQDSGENDFLFITALAAILVGTGFLMRTTGAARDYKYLWPLLVAAVGCFLIYLAVARKGSFLTLFAGLLFALLGALVLVGLAADWSFGKAWPLSMVAAAVAWTVAGGRRDGRPNPANIAPAAAFVTLGGFFSLFSFKVVKVGFGQFMFTWWPVIVIAGGIGLLVAYGAARRRGGGEES